jgi:hypothetical protein
MTKGENMLHGQQLGDSQQNQSVRQGLKEMIGAASMQQEQEGQASSAPLPVPAEEATDDRQWPNAVSAFTELAKAGEEANEVVAVTVAKIVYAVAKGVEPTVAAAAAAEELAVPACFWGGFGGSRGYFLNGPWYVSRMPSWYSWNSNLFMYTYRDNRFTCNTGFSSGLRALGASCRVVNTGMLCVQFANSAPMDLVTAQVTMSDGISSQTVVVRITVWNEASVMRPYWVPTYCVGG